MTSIDFTQIKQNISHGFSELVKGTGELAGHCVEILKSGRQTASSYLQNPRIAGLSVFVVNLIGLKLILISDAYITSRIPAKYSHYRLVATSIVGMSLYFGMVVGYAKLMQLPLSNQTVALISLVTLVGGLLWKGFEEDV